MMEVENVPEPELEGSTTENTDHTDPELVHLNGARRDNDLKLKRMFEDIFEKYERDFSDIGDEIDLFTGEIVVDNGHLENMQYEADPGTDTPARFLREYHIIEDDTEDGQLSSDDEPRLQYPHSTHFGTEPHNETRERRRTDHANPARNSKRHSANRVSRESSHRAFSSVTRPAPRLAVLLASQDGAASRVAHSPPTSREPAALRIPSGSSKLVEEESVASRLIGNVSGLQESMRMLQATDSGQTLNPNMIENLGIAIANQLAQIFSNDPAQGPVGPSRLSVAKEKAWDCPEPGEMPYPPVIRRSEARHHRNVAAPSPGRVSIWAPTLRRKKRKLSHVIASQEWTSTSKRISTDPIPSASPDIAGSSRMAARSRPPHEKTIVKTPKTPSLESRINGVSLPLSGSLDDDLPTMIETLDTSYPANTSRHRDGKSNVLKLRFTPEEDARLIHLKEVEQLPWSAIPLYFTNRSMYTLQHRYSMRLSRPCEGRALLARGALAHPTDANTEHDARLQNDSKWDNDQDELLLELREEQDLNWSEISKRMLQHSPSDLESRYSLLSEVSINQFNEKCNAMPQTSAQDSSWHIESFSKEEDALLMRLRDHERLTWIKIKPHFPGRHANLLRKRYLKIQTTEGSRHSELGTPTQIVEAPSLTETRIVQESTRLTHQPVTEPTANGIDTEPRRKRKPRYTPYEDETIVRMMRLNRTWEEIAREVPGREVNSLKYRYGVISASGAGESHLQDSSADQEDDDGPAAECGRSETDELGVRKQRSIANDNTAIGSQSQPDEQSPRVGHTSKTCGRFSESSSEGPTVSTPPETSTQRVCSDLLQTQLDASSQTKRSRKSFAFERALFKDLQSKGMSYHEICRHFQNRAAVDEGTGGNGESLSEARGRVLSSSQANDILLRKALDNSLRRRTSSSGKQVPNQSHQLELHSDSRTTVIVQGDDHSGDSVETNSGRTPQDSTAKTLAFDIQQEGRNSPSPEPDSSFYSNIDPLLLRYHGDLLETVPAIPYDPALPKLGSSATTHLHDQPTDDECLPTVSPPCTMPEPSLSTHAIRKYHSGSALERDSIKSNSDKRDTHELTHVTSHAELVTHGAVPAITQRDDIDDECHPTASATAHSESCPDTLLWADHQSSDLLESQLQSRENDMHEETQSSTDYTPALYTIPQLIDFAFERIGPGPLRVSEIVKWIEANHPRVADYKPRWKASVRATFIRNFHFESVIVNGKRAWSKGPALTSPIPCATESRSAILSSELADEGVSTKPLQKSVTSNLSLADDEENINTLADDEHWRAGQKKKNTSVSRETPVPEAFTGSTKRTIMQGGRSSSTHRKDFGSEAEAVSESSIPRRRQYRRRRILSATVIRDSEDDEPSLPSSGTKLCSSPEPATETAAATKLNTMKSSTDVVSITSPRSDKLDSYTQLMSPNTAQNSGRNKARLREIPNSQTTAPSSSEASAVAASSMPPSSNASQSDRPQMPPPPTHLKARGLPITPKPAFRHVNGSTIRNQSSDASSLPTSMTSQRVGTPTILGNTLGKRLVETPLKAHWAADVDDEEDELA